MKKGVVVAIVVLLAIAAGIAYWLTSTPRPAPEPPVAEKPEPPARPAAPEKPPEPEPKGFCERDFGAVEEREADVDDLADKGGLVHIFEREARLADPYGCADFYLTHGLNIDAVDPRDEHEPLTGLFFAIERNDPKMVHFMIDHGADLKKRAGTDEVKPMGYAYSLALKDNRIDRNKVIGILDKALTRQARSQADADKQ